MKALGALLDGIALLAANQPVTVCAETETIDLKEIAQKSPSCRHTAGRIRRQRQGDPAPFLLPLPASKVRWGTDDGIEAVRFFQ